MKCPVCKDVSLLMAERQGIEIDYCPQCRGVWLDRGELDRLIERASQRMPQEEVSGRDEWRDRERYNERLDYRYREHYRKRRKSFLGELFDFD